MEPSPEQVALDKIQALLDFGRLDEAHVANRAAVAEHPDSARLFASLAMIENRRRDFVAALAAAEHALGIEPRNALAMFAMIPALANVPSDENDGEADRPLARRAAEELVGAYPEWASAHLQKAWIFSRTDVDVPARAPDVVLESVNTAFTLDPHNAVNFAEGAEYLSLMGHGAEARRAIATALELAPTHETVLLISRRFTETEEQALDIELGVLANNPQKSDVIYDVHSRIWSRLTWLTAIPTWIAAPFATFLYLFSRDLDGIRVMALIMLAVVVLVLAGFVASSLTAIAFQRFVAAIRNARFVGPSLIATILAAIVALATTIVVLVTPMRSHAVEEPVFVVSLTILTTVAVLQAVPRLLVIHRSTALELETGLFSAAPAGRIALDRALVSRSGAGLGIFLGVVILIVSVLGLSHTNIFGVVAIAASTAALAFAKLGVGRILKSSGYGHRWLAWVWFTIAAGLYAIAVWMLICQLAAVTGSLPA